MANQVILNKSILTDIGDAIREKEGSTATIASTAMAERIKNLPAGGGLMITNGDHCDENGIWHKPDEWDDIESIDLTGKHECYLLCSKKCSDYPFVRVRVYGSSPKWSYGHVSNGVYTAISEDKSVSNGSYIALYLGNLEDDYIVIKIWSSSYLGYIQTYAWVANTDLNYAMTAQNNCILMRYGRMVRATSLVFQSYFLESDHLVDTGTYYYDSTTQPITCGAAYSGNMSLQRVKYDGMDFSRFRITSYASMFANCYMLQDVGKKFDLTGWVQSMCTTVNAMFIKCYSLRAELDVSNWDTIGLTNAGSIFEDCRCIPKITGLNTWTSLENVTTVYRMFYWCVSLSQDLDLSSWSLGKTGKLTRADYLFHSLYNVKKVNLNNCDFSKVTTVAYLFYSAGIKEIVWDTGFIPPTSVCTDFTSLFHYCFGLNEVVVDGWDFSGAISGKLANLAYNCFSLRSIKFINCISNTKADTTSTTMIRYSYNLREADFSWMDASKFTAANYGATGFSDCYQLVDFYPPKNINMAFKFTNDYNLSHDSLLRILNNLSTITSAKTLTLGAYNLAKLTDEEKSIATGKGWTLA